MGNALKDILKEEIVNTLEKHVSLVKGQNCMYSDSSEFIVWSWAGINQISIQESSEELRDCGYLVPSGDAVLDRLSKQPYRVLEHGFDQVFQDYVCRARKQRLFTHSVITAIDFTDIEWYGEELPFIVKSKAKNGTKRFIRFASIAIVEDGKRFTLKVLPVTPLSCMEDIVTELIAYVKHFVSLRVILLDRGFYSSKVIKKIKDAEVNYVMPVRKSQKVIDHMQRAYENGPITYVMSNGETYILMVVKDEDHDKLLPYATNIEDVLPSVIHEFYEHRFGIETQYRMKNLFLGKTCSKNYSVRYAFFILAVALYNLWVLLNILERGKEGLDPGTIPIKVDQLKHIFRKIIYQNAPL
ncbi:MAG: transposase [Candidatus Thermoplasmatota archaeon]|nr:transposase [Candidatus Thermoplasmatota archaeon]